MAVLVLAALLTALGWASLAAFDWFPSVRDDSTQLGMAGGVLVLAVLLVCTAAARAVPRATSAGTAVVAGFFLLTVWSAAVDQVLAMALMGWTGIGRFYVESGEEYFKTPWGVGAMAWDGTVHWALQISIASALLSPRQPAKKPPAKGSRVEEPAATPTLRMLFWAGSVLNSMPVLLLGAATGPFSADIHLSTALNTPYVLFPLGIAAWAMNQPCAAPQSPDARLARSGHDVALVCAHLGAFVLHVARAMAVLGSRNRLATAWPVLVEPVALEPSGFFRVQALQNVALLCPWHVLSVFEACHRLALRRPSLVFAGSAQAAAKCAAFAAGFVLQGQFCTLCMVMVRWDDFEVSPQAMNATGRSVFINFAIAVGAAVHAAVYAAACGPSPLSSPLTAPADVKRD